MKSGFEKFEVTASLTRPLPHERGEGDFVPACSDRHTAGSKNPLPPFLRRGPGEEDVTSNFSSLISIAAVEPRSGISAPATFIRSIFRHRLTAQCDGTGWELFQK